MSHVEMALAEVPIASEDSCVNPPCGLSRSLLCADELVRAC